MKNKQSSLSPILTSLFCLMVCCCNFLSKADAQVMGADNIIYHKDSVVIPYDYSKKPFFFVTVPITFQNNKVIHLQAFRYNQKTTPFTEWTLIGNSGYQLENKISEQMRKRGDVKQPHTDSCFQNGAYIWYYTIENQKKMKYIKNWDAQDLKDSFPVKLVTYSRMRLAAYNFVYPGWGTGEVTGNRKWNYMGLAGYGLVAALITTRLGYAYTYQKYKKSPLLYSTYGTPNLYKRSQFLHGLFYAELIASSAIWAEQILHVLLFYHPSNKNKYKAYHQKHNLTLMPNYNPYQENVSLSFHVKF